MNPNQILIIIHNYYHKIKILRFFSVIHHGVGGGGVGGDRNNCKIYSSIYYYYELITVRNFGVHTQIIVRFSALRIMCTIVVIFL